MKHIIKGLFVLSLCFPLNGLAQGGAITGRVLDQTDAVIPGVGVELMRISDIEYFYASRLPGEPDEGVEDIHLLQRFLAPLACR
jgi:hypothetical protein